MMLFHRSPESLSTSSAIALPPLQRIALSAFSSSFVALVPVRTLAASFEVEGADRRAWALPPPNSFI